MVRKGGGVTIASSGVSTPLSKDLDETRRQVLLQDKLCTVFDLDWESDIHRRYAGLSTWQEIQLRVMASDLGLSIREKKPWFRKRYLEAYLPR
jgi:hypothetical protein